MEINIIPKFIDKAAGPPAQAVGDTLSDLWKLGLGSHVSLWTQKQELKQQENFKKYQQKIEQKTQSIPEENLMEPPLHIVGPAIEASKYYIESEILQEMFANLIASSIDNRKSSETHPSFVEVIKQMSPLDAQLLALFKIRVQYPVCEFNLVTKTGQFNTYQTNVFLEKIDILDVSLIASSLANLTRLGLISISYSTFVADDFAYEKFRKHSLFKELEFKVQSGHIHSYNKVDIKKGLTKTTPIGKDFIKICL